MKKILMILMACAFIFSTFPWNSAIAEGAAKGTIEKRELEDLAKDLTELAKTILKTNELLEQMTPEEKQEFIEKFTEEVIKLQKENPEIRIKILPSK